MIWMQFLRQPTTVAGFATICGALTAVFSHTMSWGAALPIFVGAVVGILVPDNTALRGTMETLTKDAENVAASIPPK